MTSRDFCYWLQGFFELSMAGDPGLEIPLSNQKVNMIMNHLNLVFKHEIDPSIDKGNEKIKEELNQIHSPFKPQRPPGGDGLVRC